MKLIKLLMFVIWIATLGCKETRLDEKIKEILIEYISEVSLEEEDLIFITELTHGGRKIYRIYASKEVDIVNPPTEYYEVENHYIFVFDERQKKVPSEELIRKFETSNKGLYYNSEEWVIFACKDKFSLIKDTSYAPIDSLENRMGSIKCN